MHAPLGFRSGGAFDAFAQAGARVQRPLWASTSAKNPAYSTTKYVHTLVGPDTVNTLPPATINAVLASNTEDAGIRDGVDAARTVMEKLADLGIDMKAVTEKLRIDGVAAFAKSFDDLIANLDAKKRQLKAVG